MTTTPTTGELLAPCPFCAAIPELLRRGDIENGGMALGEDTNVCHGDLSDPCPLAGQVIGYSLWQTRSAPATGELREAVARIVDPFCFKAWQSSYDYCVNQGDSEDEARAMADRWQKPDMDAALTKADQIIALLPATVDRAGVVASERERCALVAESYDGPRVSASRLRGAIAAAIRQLSDGEGK